MNTYIKSKIVGQSEIVVQKDIKRGFTLIELLVVIAIIGFLASVVMASLGVSRTRAEIAKVLTDYKSVSNALELYRQANGGNYPGTEGDATDVETLITSGGLGEYIKQNPSNSSLVVDTGSISYWLNTKGNPEYLCGTNSGFQDYVISFDPTVEAVDSGMFKPLYDVDVGDYEEEGLALCIPVNQD